jgi:hypothetical protein
MTSRVATLGRAEARPYNGRYNFEPQLWLGGGVVEV